jgi:hypothetical protein
MLRCTGHHKALSHAARFPVLQYHLYSTHCSTTLQYHVKSLAGNDHVTPESAVDAIQQIIDAGEDQDIALRMSSP